MSNAISKSVLPKFARREDNFNGLGITAHDIYAIKINLLSLEVAGGSWKAKVSYQAQDHFGLDDEDILKTKFRQFKFFRLWFVLQRYVNFGYKPYFTNMDATIEIKGDVL